VKKLEEAEVNNWRALKQGGVFFCGALVLLFAASCERTRLRVTTHEVTDITDQSAIGGGTVRGTDADFVSDRGVIYSTNPEPTTFGYTRTSDGTGAGSFTSAIYFREPNTTYYVRAFASNTNETVFGEIVEFKAGINIPTLTTSLVSYSVGTATFEGTVVPRYVGVIYSSFGFCWNTSSKPTINDSKNIYYGDKDDSRKYTFKATGLNQNTKYYVRSYMSVSIGSSPDSVCYGNEITFTTPPELPYRMVSAGEDYALAIKTDGTLWAWGRNWEGQLGDGTIESRTAPVLVGSDFVTVATGRNFSFGIKADRTLWAWGSNKDGELGDGSKTRRMVPTRIGSDYTGVTAGIYFNVAFKSDGTMWAWGSDEREGNIGCDAAGCLPTKVASGYTDGSMEAALKTDGTIWTFVNTPPWEAKLVDSDPNYTFVASSVLSHFAVKKDGTLWAWGLNNVGQLGDGTTENRDFPVLIGIDYVAVAPDYSNKLALKKDGSLWEIGWSWQTQKRISLPVKFGTGTYKAMSAGGSFNLAIDTNDRLWSWGNNYAGQLGVGIISDATSTPVLIGPK
jgi:alpha-tubulin suppressor-like RCC1 family protein